MQNEDLLIGEVGKAGGLKSLLLACRPGTLLVGIGPVILGNALGMKDQLVMQGQLTSFNWILGLATFLFVVCLQSAANLVNDAKDFLSGVDTEKRLGPVRYTQTGLITVNDVQALYRGLIFFALLMGSAFMMRGGWPVALIALSSALVAYSYTGGPVPLSHYGMGEFLALIFFGPVAVGGSYYMQTLSVSQEALFLGLGPGLISAAMMAINNYRDRLSDQKVGKKTLAVFFGEAVFGRWFPFILLLASLIILVANRWQSGAWAPAVGVVLVGIGYLRSVLQSLKAGEAALLNASLKKISFFNFIYCVLLSLCLW